MNHIVSLRCLVGSQFISAELNYFTVNEELHGIWQKGQ